MAVLGMVNLKITRTPLSGGASTTITETRTTPLRRVRRCTADRAQSIGDQGGNLELDNTGGYFDSWTPGDVVRIEIQRPRDAAYTAIAEGYVGEPEIVMGERPIMRVNVVGLNAILDLITLSADVTFVAGYAFTDAFNDLCNTYLTGYTKSITTDTSTLTYPVTFEKGTKLREAFDFLRRALRAKTSQAWEMVASKNGATKTISLYKRATTNQATYNAKDALAGTRRGKGSAFGVVNKAVIVGATKPQLNIDKSTLSVLGTLTLDSTAKLAAQPFIAQATPLYSHQLYADRSGGSDPPSLAGKVVRNSDNVDRLASGIGRRIGSSITRNRTVSSGTIAGLDDHNLATNCRWDITASFTDTELVCWDFGSAKNVALFITAMNTAMVLDTVKFWGSNDDSSWTALTAGLTMGTATTYTTSLNVGPWRYVRVTASSGAAGSRVFDFDECHVVEFDNAASSTNPHNCLSDYDGTLYTTVATTGAVTSEVYRCDFGSAQPFAKLVVKHKISVVDASITLRWQSSSNGSTWSDLSISSSTTSDVVDTFYLDGVASFRYLRLVVQDDRAAASASRTTSVDYVLAYVRVDAWGTAASGHGPLIGDSMRGSTWTWTVESLVKHPALIEAQTWSAPRLALDLNGYYWFVYTPQSGASATKYWVLSYGQDDFQNVAPIKSTDSGATWSDVYGSVNTTFLHTRAFNNAPLVGTAEDTTSQTKYANFVPGGILYGGLRDDALVTQEMVDQEAAALVKARADVVDRIVLIVPLDPAIDVGSRVTLGQDFLYRLGTQGAFDVLQVSHEAVPAARTIMILNDRPPDDAASAVTAYATKRSI